MKNTLPYFVSLTALASVAMGDTLAPSTTASTEMPITQLGQDLKAINGDVQLVGALAGDSSMPNLWGVRLGGSLYQGAKFNDKYTHEVNFSLALLKGDESGKISYQGYPIDQDIDAFILPVMFGYNGLYKINDKLDVFAGAKVGLTYFQADVCVSGYGYSKSGSDKTGAFTMAVGVGAQYQINKTFSVKLGYEFTHHVTIVDSDSEYNDYSVTTDMTNYHVLYVGAVIDF